MLALCNRTEGRAGSEAIIQRHGDCNFLPISREIRHMHRIRKVKGMDGPCVFPLLQLKPHFINVEENALNYLCVVHICSLVWLEVYLWLQILADELYEK